jgi:hypothetical protein
MKVRPTHHNHQVYLRFKNQYIKEHRILVSYQRKDILL